MTTTIVCVGNAAFDRIWSVPHLPATGQKIRSTAYLEVGGGQAANAAVAIARLGGRVSLIAAVGTDAVAALIRASLVAEHVDVAGLHVVEGARSISSMIMVEPNGERAVVGDVDPRLHAHRPDIDPGLVSGAQAILADVKWPAAAEQVLAAARRLSVPTVLDIEPALAGNHERLCPLADHALFSRAGLAAFAATGDVTAGLRVAFARLGVVVGVTLGEQGVRLLSAQGPLTVAAPKVAVVDTTGAGDVFHGAYALAIGEGRDVAAAARFACAVAALKCTRPGRAGLPTRAEVERFLAGA